MTNLSRNIGLIVGNTANRLSFLKKYGHEIPSNLPVKKLSFSQNLFVHEIMRKRLDFMTYISPPILIGGFIFMLLYFAQTIPGGSNKEEYQIQRQKFLKKIERNEDIFYDLRKEKK